ncbi:amidohydrolase 2 [Atractiella rhizophila]|nr:amidohydrolase 2 [Atractiella rhizophila]
MSSMSTSKSSTPVIDVHTHVYLPRYLQRLRARNVVPRITTFPDAPNDEKMLILPGEEKTGKGRPLTKFYWDRDLRLQWMDKHNIDISVISLANPWLDFLSPASAIEASRDFNNEMEEFCTSVYEDTGRKRIFGMGILPLIPLENEEVGCRREDGEDEMSVDTLVQENVNVVESIASSKYLKGIILGTQGFGKGLDDSRLVPIFRALADANLPIFLHPHYGLPPSLFGSLPNGHVLPLALGFPVETTISISRLLLSGIYDELPHLKIMLAHSGGVLPYLSSRLNSCVEHDPVVRGRLKQKDVRSYLGKLYYDAVAYGSEELEFLEKVIKRAGSGVSDQELHPTERILFGTDCPFFPPLDADPVKAEWTSVKENVKAIYATPFSADQHRAVLGGNAIKFFNLDL